MCQFQSSTKCLSVLAFYRKANAEAILLVWAYAHFYSESRPLIYL